MTAETGGKYIPKSWKKCYHFGSFLC